MVSIQPPRLMKPVHIRLCHTTQNILGYPTRIELVIAESQPAVLPLNYGHHKKSTNKCDGIRTQPSRPVSPFIRPCKGFNSGTRSRYASHYISTTCHSSLQCPMSSLVPYQSTLTRIELVTELEFGPSYVPHNDLASAAVYFDMVGAQGFEP